MVGVYIHIPFCKNICSYCDFCKFLYNKDWVILYLKALKDEINERYMNEMVKTIYIGGGTPSSLSLKEIEYLLMLTDMFDKKFLEEFTFECNIEDINEELLLLLKKYNVNRLSVGIESFDSDNLALMNRESDFYDAKEKINLCRKLGFNNINIDLIYALPDEDLLTLKDDLNLLLKLNPDHISTYSLEIHEHTKFYANNIMPIKEELDFEMYNYITKKLIRKGYNHYEVSNFSLSGFESIHNMIYWNNEEYYGFGCGAAGYIGGVRYDNTRNLTKYLNGLYKGKEELISKKAQMDYEIILGLRKTKGIDIKHFFRKYHQNIQDVYNIRELIQNNDLIYENGHIFVNPKKIYLMNEILVKIV